MTLPHVLCVDDSETILAFERATLSGHYTLSTAMNGREALQKVRAVRPDAVLLDLSMPELDGDRVLAQLAADERLRDIPVVVVTSEAARAEACLRAGAAAFLAKPIRAADLLRAVEGVLEARRARERRSGLAVLVLEVGPLELAIPLASVDTVLLMPALRPVAMSPSFVAGTFDLYGRPVLALDLPTLLGVHHLQALPERKLVVVHDGDPLLALVADTVHDPEEVGATEVFAPDHLGAAGHEPLATCLVAMIRGTRGPIPVLSPRAFLSPDELARAADLLRPAPEHAGATP